MNTQNPLVSLGKNTTNDNENILSFPTFLNEGLSDKDSLRLEKGLSQISALLLIDFVKQVEKQLEKFPVIYLGSTNEYNDENYEDYFHAKGATQEQFDSMQNEDEDTEEISEELTDLSFEVHNLIDHIVNARFATGAESSYDLSEFHEYTKQNIHKMYEKLLGEKEYAEYKVLKEKYGLETQTPQGNNNPEGVNNPYIMKI